MLDKPVTRIRVKWVKGLLILNKPTLHGYTKPPSPAVPQIEMDLQRKKIVVRSGAPEQGVADAGEWDIPDDAA